MPGKVANLPEPAGLRHFSEDNTFAIAPLPLFRIQYRNRDVDDNLDGILEEGVLGAPKFYGGFIFSPTGCLLRPRALPGVESKYPPVLNGPLN